MADVAKVELEPEVKLSALAPGECFVTPSDFKKEGREASVWMKVEKTTRQQYSSKPEVGFGTINLSNGKEGGHILSMPVLRVGVTIVPVMRIS